MRFLAPPLELREPLPVFGPGVAMGGVAGTGVTGWGGATAAIGSAKELVTVTATVLFLGQTSHSMTE